MSGDASNFPTAATLGWESQLLDCFPNELVGLLILEELRRPQSNRGQAQDWINLSKSSGVSESI